MELFLSLTIEVGVEHELVCEGERRLGVELESRAQNQGDAVVRVTANR